MHLLYKALMVISTPPALEDLCCSSLNKVSQICDAGISESCQQLSESSLHDHNTANVLLPPLLQVCDYQLWFWMAASAECDAPYIDVLSEWKMLVNAPAGEIVAYSSTYTSLLYRKEWRDHWKEQKKRERLTCIFSSHSITNQVSEWPLNDSENGRHECDSMVLKCSDRCDTDWYCIHKIGMHRSLYNQYKTEELNKLKINTHNKH